MGKILFLSKEFEDAIANREMSGVLKAKTDVRKGDEFDVVVNGKAITRLKCDGCYRTVLDYDTITGTHAIEFPFGEIRYLHSFAKSVGFQNWDDLIEFYGRVWKLPVHAKLIRWRYKDFEGQYYPVLLFRKYYSIEYKYDPEYRYEGMLVYYRQGYFEILQQNGNHIPGHINFYNFNKVN